MNKESSDCYSNDASPPSAVFSSCLRSRPDSYRRNRSFSVTFPEDESDLITGYLEPANPWQYADNVNREDLIKNYKASCEKHGTNPLPVVVEQLQTVNVEASRSNCLNLKGATLMAVACESLEEVLKRVQFKNINVEATALDDEGSVALFDMIEYYESATHLNISSNKDIAVRGWQACSRMIKKTRCLEQLEARNVTLNEQYMPILSRALKSGTQLQVLKLENCALSGRPIIILAAALKLNSGLKELYLADNTLNVSDAVQLGALLRTNQTLQLLDVSNNQIQDAGVGHILDGLSEQASPGNCSGSGNSSSSSSSSSSGGLCILVLWNNHLTRNAAKHFARALARSTSLEILNVGHNVLTNESLHVMKDSLQQNRTLLRLGMQSTHVSCEGAIALAECIADNPVIQRIDLRDNNVQVAGLMALTLSMKVNRSVSQLDLDDKPKKKLESGEALKQYQELLEEIRGFCARNEQAEFYEGEPRTPEDKESVSETKLRVTGSVASRKISLTCETLMRSVCMQSNAEHSGSQLLEPRRASGGRLRSPAPSPVPSPVSSPIPSPSRTRFQVSKVAEPSGSPSSCSSSPFTPPSVSPSPTRFFPGPGTSRFRVTLVEPKDIPPLQPVVASPSGSNVTVGFTFKLNDQNVSPKSSPEDSQTGSPACEDAASHSPPVSKLSEALAAADKLAPSENDMKDLAEILLTKTIGTLSIFPSQSISSLEDSADLEVRQIMDRHDNQTKSDILNKITDSSSSKACAQELSQLDESLQKQPVMNKIESPVATESIVADTQLEIKTQERASVSHKPSPASLSVSEKKPEKPSESGGTHNQSAIVKSCKTVNQRLRKISWIAPVEPVSSNEQKAPSGLEKLLGLFHHPTSFFSKAQPQYKATTVIVNQQPVANSNASFLLTAGPLAEAAREARLHGVRGISPDPSEEHPATDALNNNSSSECSPNRSRNSSEEAGIPSPASTSVLALSPSAASSTFCKDSFQSVSVSGIETYSLCTSREKDRTQIRTEDENLNVSSKSSRNNVRSAAEDKLWCSPLSSVCGASAVLPWTQTSASHNECHQEDCSGHCTSSSGMVFQDEKAFSKEKGSTERLYSSVVKSTPANGVNVPITSSSLWSSGKEARENLLPIAGVRLVGGGGGGGDTNSEGEHRSIDVYASHASECKTQRELVKVEEAERESVNPADP